MLRHLAGLLLRWPLAVAIGFDVFTRALFFGPAWQTWSASFGRGLAERDCPYCGAICAVLARILGKDHCQESWRIYQEIDRITGDEK